ncbi:MAG: hypothetical protein ABL958_01360 [Bdellovibrionia bacterium]
MKKILVILLWPWIFAVADSFPKDSQGKFQAIGPAKIFDTGRFGPGCAIKGLPFHKAQVDARAPFGGTYVTEELFRNGPGPLRTVGKDTIIWLVGDQKIGYFETFSKVHEVPGLPSGFQTYKSCPFHNGELQCVFTPFPPAHNPADGQYVNCSAKRSRKSRPVAETGIFRFSDGREVAAYRVAYSIGHTDYRCTGEYFKEVTSSITEIYSNEVPSWETSRFCGGTLIYNSRVDMALLGHFVSGYSKEIVKIE